MKKLFFLFISSILLFSCSKKEENVLYIYNWTEYIPENLINKFEEDTGIKVIYSTYDSNETLYSKMKIQQGIGYDLIFPSSYYIDKMVNEDMLIPLDSSKVDFSLYRPELLDELDMNENRYSIPYLWGPSVLAYNSKHVDEEDTSSWLSLLNPKYKGYVFLNNDVREVFQMALMTLGYSGNSTNEEQIEQAYQLLKKLVPSVRLFSSESPRQPFINEEVFIGLTWSGEVYKAMLDNDSINFSYPKEGTILWIDSIAIPKGAKNIENAYTFINYISKPEVAAYIAESLGYSTPNIKALEILPKSYTENRLMNPTSQDLYKAELQKDIGQGIILYEKYWEKLKTGK